MQSLNKFRKLLPTKGKQQKGEGSYTVTHPECADEMNGVEDDASHPGMSGPPDADDSAPIENPAPVTAATEEIPTPVENGPPVDDITPEPLVEEKPSPGPPKIKKTPKPKKPKKTKSPEPPVENPPVEPLVNGNNEAPVLEQPPEIAAKQKEEKPKKEKKEKKEKPKKEKKPKEVKPEYENKCTDTENGFENGHLGEREPMPRKKFTFPACPIRCPCVNWDQVMGGKRWLSKRKMSLKLRSALTKLVCGLYALFLISLGIVFSLADALTATEREHKYYLEGFLLYLYLISLLFLIYFQLALLRGVSTKGSNYDTNLRVTVRRSTENINTMPGSPQLDLKRLENLEKGHDNPAEQMSVTTDITNNMELPHDGSVAHVGEGINFYLRLGALAFSLGSISLDGFHIASYFESDATKECRSVIFIPVYVAHLLFTFFQTFFLFKNHKLVIDRYKACVRFGMMHLMATNLCVWIVTIVNETAAEYRQKNYQKTLSSGVMGNSCYGDVTLGRSASPYLFPCTIIYSIIAAGIIYRMYQYIGIKVKQRWPSHLSLTSSAPYGAASLDCDKANKGLFLGLMVSVLTAIAIATFFVFESRLGDSSTAVKVFYVTQISLIVFTALGMIFGYLRLSKLKFVESYFLSLDSTLLLIALCGCFIYFAFTLISIASSMPDSVLVVVLSLVCISIEFIQVTFQTVFVLDGLCRCADNDEQMLSKPGRAAITFLLVSNIALWAVSMFEMKKTMMLDIYEQFYGVLSWNIITHLFVPLLIFFRFHSAICLSKIWYQAYQKEKLI